MSGETLFSLTMIVGGMFLLGSIQPVPWPTLARVLIVLVLVWAAGYMTGFGEGKRR